MFTKKGYIFIGLNAVRILSIISLILVFASSILVMVNDIKAVNRFTDARHNLDDSSSNSTALIDMLDCDYIEDSTVPNQPAGVFWAVLNRLLIIFQVVALILSELGWPQKFFKKYFPVLGNDFGVGALGVIQCLLGAAVLSHHVDDFALVSSFLLFSVGCLNILLGLIFRESIKHKRSLLFWNERFSDLQLPTSVRGVVPAFPVHVHSTGNSTMMSKGGAADGKASFSNEKQHHHGMGFGRQGEKAAEALGLFIARPVESVPPYAPRPKSDRSSTPPAGPNGSAY